MKWAEEFYIILPEEERNGGQDNQNQNELCHGKQENVNLKENMIKSLL